MKRRLAALLLFPFILTACGNPPPGKAILGAWVQDTPTSTTDNGLEATTSNTVLTFEKDGDVSLQRQLDLRGPSLPASGISLDVALSGTWRIEGETLIQTLENATVIPRETSDLAKNISDQLQGQSNMTSETRKTILVLEKNELILQDSNTDVTDIYRRK